MYLSIHLSIYLSKYPAIASYTQRLTHALKLQRQQHRKSQQHHPSLFLSRKKEIPYKEDILKGIGSSEGMHPYDGEVGRIYGVRDSTRQELPAEVRA
jgi:hypothetical protein